MSLITRNDQSITDCKKFVNNTDNIATVIERPMLTDGNHAFSLSLYEQFQLFAILPSPY